MMHHPTAGNGLLAAFEGIDGAGKTTQAKLLRDWISAQRFPVTLLREPTDGPHGQEIRRLSRTADPSLTPEREFELFLADRRQNVDTAIRPALRRGEIVILDRYYISSMAYQGARGLDPAEIRRANEAFAPVPDLVVVFEIPVEEALRRLEHRHASQAVAPDHFETEERLTRVKAIFDSLTGFSRVERISTTLPLEQVQARLRTIFSPFLTGRGIGTGRLPDSM
jgi:dTMP kinase